MDRLEIVRFMQAIWPKASAIEINRIDPTIAIRAATNLIVDQRTRLADIDIALRGILGRELASRVQSILKRPGPGTLGGQPPIRAPFAIGQPLIWIRHNGRGKYAQHYGYTGARIPVRCIGLDPGKKRSVQISFVAWPGQIREHEKKVWVEPQSLDPQEEPALSSGVPHHRAKKHPEVRS